MSQVKPMHYWRSFDELEQAPEFREAVKREFPNDEWDRLPPATRRQFLKVMGASVAMAGFTGCRWPKEEIVPFAHRPAGRTPGVAEQYATSLELGGAALGLLVTSMDGRPIKNEGNPLHPDSLGALPAVAQSDILGLYDPDRSVQPLLRQSGQDFVKTWDDFASWAEGRITDSGAGVAVLVEPSSSPTVERLRRRFSDVFPSAEVVEYAPISRDAERRGTAIAYGRPLRPHPHLDRARVIACFDADPFFDHPASIPLSRQFAEARKPSPDGISRLWVAEPSFTITGGRADHRRATPASQIPRVLAGLARELVATHHLELPEEAVNLESAFGATIFDDDFIPDLAADLMEHRAASVILVGPAQAPEVHALAAVLNQGLGAVGETLSYTDAPDPGRPDHVEALAGLTARMVAGAVETIVILGGNPVYDAPVDLGFADALSAVPNSVHLSHFNDETSRVCSWHLPRAHALEAWGDGRSWNGTITLRQPLIEPLYGGRSSAEVLAMLLGESPPSGHDLVRETMDGYLDAADFEASWKRALHDGVIADTAAPAVEVALDGSLLAGAVASLTEMIDAPAPTVQGPELVLRPDRKVYDGRWTNNAWQQELPDAITKTTWDNVVEVAPPTARELGLKEGDVVEITSSGATLELPVCIVPGQAAATFTTTLGYGRTAAGSVGDGVGADTYRLRSSASPWGAAEVGVSRTGKSVALAITQDHFAIDPKGFGARNSRIGILIREASLDHFLADPEVFHHMDHHPPLISLWKDQKYPGEQWGMAIDLNACNGCNACVVACQAENNVPVVGREQVINQREMHWLRVDRYFKTEPGVGPYEVDDAEMVFQPMTCVQCENAPCEQVCPVAATQHTEDGINAMVYNRCIGTRYCSNNCPFKVRRFNFFNYHKDLTDTEQLQFNPEVTVRSRGVMEKCTYCVQRIQKVRIAARNDNRPVTDGEIVPACAQTCPTNAIAFGDLNDPTSEVSRLREDKRAYATLAELNIRPRTQYLARLSNKVGGSEPAHHAPAHHDDADSHGKEG
ncbi:MAG: TAT-variant-translocated molybdopterin oxidoreductase [Thermoanaerobaculales bacterium]|jgi:molybdopterin-containing oxidoreductase family iron-sulfur binding subunit|nr:TAT-variant-translocated molybdopterin oxidoreductase [Thermoanaerobaculales bacterium]